MSYHEGPKERYFRMVREASEGNRRAYIENLTKGVIKYPVWAAWLLVELEEERDELRRKFLKMRQKRNNKRQTLAALRLRHEELHQDYAALQADLIDALEKLAEARAAWEDVMVELEELRRGK